MLLMSYVFPIKDTDINIPNVTTRIYEAMTSVKYILGNYKCQFNSATGNSNEIWKNSAWQVECKKYWLCKKDYG